MKTSIREIIKIISNKHNIEEKMSIKYKDKKDESMYIIDPDSTIEDIYEDMEEKENKYKYFLYVEINKTKKKETKEIKEKETKEIKEKETNKIKKNIFNNDDDAKIKKKKPIKKYLSEEEEEEENDDNNNKDDIKLFKKKKQKKHQDSSSSEDEDEDEYKNKNKKTKSPNKRTERSSKSMSRTNKTRYRFQTNKNNKMIEIYLDSESTIKTMKIKIAKIHGIKNPNNIKIFFAGKELLDDLSLESLEIRDAQLLPLTAKTLREDYDDDKNEDTKIKKKKSIKKYLSEEEEENDDDNNNKDDKKLFKKKKQKKHQDSSSSEDEDKNKNKKTKSPNKKVKKKEIIDDDDDDDKRTISKLSTKTERSIKSMSRTNKTRYRFQTNKNNKMDEIYLDSESTVKTMKIKIAKIHGIKNPNNIKILFAGKELLDDLSLELLEIGDAQLFVYILSEEDILLFSAKALREDNDDEYDE